MNSTLHMSIEFSLYLMAGLGLVIFAMKTLAQGFQTLCSGAIKYLINALSTNPITSLFVGIINSFFIQSGFSSSLMALSYSSSGLLSLNQLIFLLIGSGFGTVATVWLFAIPTAGYDMYLIALGVLPMMYGHYSVFSSVGRVVFSLGLLFFGFNLMLQPASPEVIQGFANSTSFVSTLNPIITYLFIALLVTLLSFLLRSTVAVMALTMALVYHQALPITVGVMIAVSANFGRTVPVLVSAFQAGLRPRRGALATFCINLSGLIFAAFFFQQMMMWLNQFRAMFYGQGDGIIIMIPAAHLLFNVFVLCLAFLFQKPLQWIMMALLPEGKSKEPQKLKFIGRTIHISPALAVEQVFQEIKKMAATCETTLELTSIYLTKREPEMIEKVLKYEKVTDNIKQEIFDFLEQVMKVSLSESQGMQVRALLRMSNELESIADRCKQIILCKKEITQIGVPHEGELNDDIKSAVEKLKDVYELTFWQLTLPKSNNTQEYRKKLREFDDLILALKKDYLSWVKDEAESQYQVEAGLKYGDMLFAIQQIRGRSENLFEAYRYGYLKN